MIFNDQYSIQFQLFEDFKLQNEILNDVKCFFD